MASERLLVVSDAPPLGAAVTDVLAAEGYEIIRARDAATAVVMVGSGGVDALLTSTRTLPPTTCDLIAGLRAHRRVLPALHLSDAPGGDEAVDVVWPPDVHVLRRPFTDAELLQAVRALFSAGPPENDLWTRIEAALHRRYRFGRTLDSRGTSGVFLAEERALGRLVVVKVLHPQFVSSISAASFRLEIRLAARLQHPFIVPLFAAGEADGLIFYTMPFVDGEGLKERLASRGALPIEEAIRILRNVATALSYAHAHGIVHRDIKPANILLSGGEAMVTDFGVAKALEAAVEYTGATPTGLVYGTVAYMAPEQAAADGALDQRADLYAWGCVAYELLTGAPPFSGRPVMATLTAHAAEVPPPVHQRRPSVPPVLAAIVMQCLRKAPADRPASAHELLRVLDAVGAGRTASRSPEPPRRDARGTLRRLRRVWAHLRAAGRWPRP